MRKIISVIAAAALVITPAFAADNTSVKDSTGATVTFGDKDVSGVHYRKDICVTLADTTIDCMAALNSAIKAEDVASADADKGFPAYAVRKATPANTSGTDGDYEPLQISGGLLWTNDKTLNTVFGTATDASIQSGACTTALACWRSIRDDLRTLATDTSVPTVVGFAGTATTTVTRPADGNLYAANDAFQVSTSAPTSGGETLTGMCRTSGGSGVITDIVFMYSTAVAVDMELWIFDSTLTGTLPNDNAAWVQSDTDVARLVARVPFTTTAEGGSATSAVYHAQNLNIGYTCVSSANLRFQVKIKTSYTPASGDILTVRAKYVQTN